MKKLPASNKAFVAFVVVISTALVGTAFATTLEPTLPSSPSDPHFFDPQLKVTPSDMLTEGQVVSVDGTRFGSNQTGVLRECNQSMSLCSSASTPFTTGRNGDFGPFDNPKTASDPNSVPVNFTVHVTFLSTAGPTVNCATSNCVIQAFSSQVGEIRAGCHHLTFFTTDATPCTLPSSVTTSSSSTSSSSSSSSTSSTSTSSSSTTPSTSSTSTSTSTTSSSTSTSTSTSSSTTSTSTTLPGGSTTTTSTTAPLGRCAALLEARRRLNTQVNAYEATLVQVLSGPARHEAIARLERSRAAALAQIDGLRAGCPSANG